MSSKLSLGLSLCCILFVINIHGRSISEWSINTDPSIINECLTKSVRYINRHEEAEVQSQDAKNVVLTSHINNGYNLKITFDLGGKHWECKLYKSLVQVLSAKLEECVQASPENEQEQSNNDIDNSEKQIDELNQEQQAADKANVLSNQEDKEEDDEDIVGKPDVPSNQENNSNQPEEDDEQDDDDIADKPDVPLNQENNNNQPEEDKEEDDEEVVDKVDVP